MYIRNTEGQCAASIDVCCCDQIFYVFLLDLCSWEIQRINDPDERSHRRPGEGTYENAIIRSESSDAAKNRQTVPSRVVIDAGNLVKDATCFINCVRHVVSINFINGSFRTSAFRRST